MSLTVLQKRDKVLKVRVAGPELAAIQQRADHANQNLSDYVRAAALGTSAISADMTPATAMAELIAALARLQTSARGQPMTMGDVERIILDLVPAVRAELGLDL